MTEPTSPPAPSPDLPSRPLRFVVLLDGLTVPRWQQRLIELLRATPGAELVAVGQHLSRALLGRPFRH